MMKRVVLNCAVMYTAARIRNNFITLSLFSTLLFSMDHTHDYVEMQIFNSFLDIYGFP